MNRSNRQAGNLANFKDAPLTVFCAYSRRDERLLGQFREHLSPMKRQGLIDVWHDRKIIAGEDWEAEIDQNLEAADLVLLIVSASFIDSDYSYGKEMHQALQRHERGEAVVIPVIVRSVDDWRSTPFGKLQAVPSDGRPVTGWPDRDAAWSNAASSIRRAVDEILIRRRAVVGSSPKKRDLSTAPRAMTENAKGQDSPAALTTSNSDTSGSTVTAGAVPLHLGFADQIEALLGSDPVWGNDAVLQLAQTPDRALSTLMAMFPERAFTHQATHRLRNLFGLIGEPAVGPLVQMIAEGSWRVKVKAASCFSGALKAVSSRELAVMLENYDPDVVRLAVEALGRVGASEWWYRIREVADSSSYMHQKLHTYAIIALARMLANETDRFQVPYHLARFEDLIDDWGGRGWSFVPADKRFVYEALRDVRPIVADAVISQWARHQDPLFRILAQRILGQLRLNRTINTLSERIVDDTDEGVRSAAATALGQFRSQLALRQALHLDGQLSQAERTEKSSESMLSLGEDLRYSVARLLYKATREMELDPIIPQLLAADWPETRSHTLFALGVLGRNDKDVEYALHSEDWLDRGAAALALARLGTQDVTPKLREVVSEATEPLEKLLSLAALAQTEADEAADRLHEELKLSAGSEVLVHNLNHPWKREIVYGLTKSPLDGLRRAEAWADLMGEDLESCMTEIALELSGSNQ